MKKILLSTLCLTSVVAFAQPKVITEGVVTAKMQMIVPESDDDVANVQGGGGGQMMRMGGDMDMKTTVSIKGAMMRTDTKSDFGTFSSIRDNEKKITTTLMSMMGQKTAYYATDEQSSKNIDSLLKAQGVDSNRIRRENRRKIDIVEAEGTKKIAGYQCKKAYIVSTNQLGVKDSSIVWYTSEVKMPYTLTQMGGGGRGMMMRMGGGMAGLDKIDGMPMWFETKFPQGRKLVYEVTKIDLDKKVDDKTFEVPKDYELKPASDMFIGGMRGTGGGDGPRREIRIEH